MFFQGNARRLFDKRCDGNSPLGKISKLGLAPALWIVIIILLVTYIHSVVLGKKYSFKLCFYFWIDTYKLFFPNELFIEFTLSSWMQHQVSQT